LFPLAEGELNVLVSKKLPATFEVCKECIAVSQNRDTNLGPQFTRDYNSENQVRSHWAVLFNVGPSSERRLASNKVIGCVIASTLLD
jgi:hypothetical protein